MSAPIIITVPNYVTMEDEDSDVVDVAPATPSRKRRLDHLTWEEKMQRKKLKNRVAAQTSRDRKKAKMDEMESKINHFMAINERLVKEVKDLKAMNERLLSENTSLKTAARTVAKAPGPAASPQQKEGPSPAIRAARASGASQDESSGESRKCSEGAQVVGTTTKHMESSEGDILDSEINIKHDVDRISEHSYAHPYTDDENGDKGDLFYASYEANDCVTVEVSDEAEEMEMDLKLANCSDITLECDMKLLSPMCLSPKSIEENLGLSPSHTILSSDLGYESLASPLSETDLDLPDLSDFWCESFSELFPALA
ncbi:unnamed protein product [Pieris macdunnoughi]|uniref:X-box-binding protein 1 n=1 Tax=Pieris macdunnoughi TaxID=345717 RepID=A0A821RJ15_9NEOP|nr:unnamed protein product [Pieris macdunnoughi]